MTRKKIDKKMHCLEPKFHDILICKKNDCRPFIEVLVEEPENVSSQNLGILAGIFQIDDRSEDSSYVVNYLISIIKKEYFSRTNRGPVENFESALHKANLALAKLASHENINWIGHINAICAVIEKNNLLLSQTGDASVFLLRGTVLTEITEIQDEKADSNPLKTFQDVISGKIEKDDKLLFTTKEMFDIFSLEEIKKSALKFSRENFIQFLNTAFINELDQVATLIIDIEEKTNEIVKAPPDAKPEEINVFSQTAFQKKLPQKKIEKEQVKEETLRKERQEISQELKEDVKDFVDEKTGHIYIKESHNQPEEIQIKKNGSDLFLDIKEKITALSRSGAKSVKNITNKATNLSASFLRKSYTKIVQLKIKKTPAKIIYSEEKNKSAIASQTTFIQIDEVSAVNKLKSVYSKLKFKTKAKAFWKKMKPKLEWLEDKATDGLVLILRKPTNLAIKLTASLKHKWRNYRIEKQAERRVKKYPWEITPSPAVLPKTELQKISPALSSKTARFGQFIEPKKILPNFSRLKQITKSLDQKQTLSVVAALILLLIVPYWIAKWESGKIEKKPEVSEEIPMPILPLEKDLSVTRIGKLDDIYSGNILKIINLNGKFFAQTETEIIELENKKSIPLSSNLQNPELLVGMDDLNLIFIIKNNRVASLAPTTGKFLENTITFPEKAKIIDAKTYLTYLYLLDGNNNQIYRYPRAEGGFSEKTAWLKDNIDLSSAKSLAINENIFVLNGQNILKLFRGKKLDFSIENTATPITPDKLYAKNTSANLYILDKTNSRIIKLDGEGKILAQYYNADIAGATDFSVNEESNLVYISNTSGVKSFKTTQTQ